MRILLVGDYPPNPTLGSTKVLLKLQEEFRALGHDCDVLLADGLGSFPRNGYLRQAFAPVSAFASVSRMIASKGGYDVIDVASAEGLWLAKLRPSALGRAVVIARSNGLEHLNYRRMLDDHDAGLLAKPWTRRLFHPAVRLSQVAAAARAADRLLLLNDSDRAFAVSRGWKRADLIDVVAHGVSERFLREEATADAPRGNGVLFCGSWTEVKGVTYLTEAFERMVQLDDRAQMTILGGGRPAEDICRSFSAAARRSLTVIDRAPEERVMAAYRDHDVLAWPSTYEGFGMVVVEAMSQRLPVVGTSVGCGGTLIVDERTGLRVPPRDSGALAAALMRMLSDAPLRARCGTAARARVLGMSWRATAEQTLQVYDRAIRQRSAAA